MDLAKLGAELFQQQAAGGKDSHDVGAALQQLLGGSGQSVDLSGMLQNMLSQGDLQQMAASWLGQGSNAPIGGEQIMALFDSGQIQQFADKLGIDLNSALTGLAAALPQMVDKASPDGRLDPSAAGSSDTLMNLARKFLN